MRISSLARRIIIFVAIALASVTTSARAGNPFDFLVVTEFSSTVLTATFNSIPLNVVNTSADQWTITLPGFQPSLGPADWIEPDNALLVNRLTMDAQGHQIFVFSDTVFQQGDMITNDGQSLITAVGLITTFHDLADSSSAVPESGSTLAHLGIAVPSLLLLRLRVSHYKRKNGANG